MVANYRDTRRSMQVACEPRALPQRMGQGSSVSLAEVEEKRALMLPQELKALDPTKEIVFIEGTPYPVLCSKIRYYEDSYFKARLLGASSVPRLDVGRRP